MTEIAHTPGPWEIREIAHEATPFGPRRVYRVEIGSPIIDRASKHRYGTRRVCHITDFADFTNDTANARLIAAAPDLLKALEIARAMIRGEIIENAIIDTQSMQPLGAAIDAAIAAAKLAPQT